jgi:hypothetical protein
MGSRLLIAVAAGLALSACTVQEHRVARPAAVAVAPVTSTIVYTDPVPTTTVYTAAAPTTTVYATPAPVTTTTVYTTR